MNTTLGRAPFLRIVIVVIIGILMQSYLQLPVYMLSTILIILFVSILYTVFVRQDQFQFKYKYFFSCLVFLLLLVLGMLLFAIQDVRLQKRYYAKFLPDSAKECQWQVLLNDDIHQTKSGIRTTATVVDFISDTLTYTTSGKLNLIIMDSAAISTLHYGDKIIIKTKISEISAAKNPNEFDTRSFYANKNVHYQAFIRNGDYTILSHKECSVLHQWIHKLRYQVCDKMQQHIKDQDAMGVCKALIIGIEEDLDVHLMKAYASSGVIHVLSVSGLHVGIFYIMINYLFAFIKNDSTRIRWLKALLSLLLIWFYALLSGFSPSVLRSAVMLTCVILGATLKRKISLYNSLAASCFILLCCDAKYIFDVGFQLSYLAVAGIAYLQQKIYAIYIFKNYLLDKISNMTAVSLSAQLITFPLSVYYFYQFPLLFLFANLLVIPIISLALPLGFLFMFACLFGSDTVLHFIAYPLEWCIIISNKIIFFFDRIPFNSLRPVFFTSSQLVGVYLCIIIFFIAIELKYMKYWIVFLLMLFTLFVSFIVEKYTHLNQAQLLVFNIANTQRIELVQANKTLVFTDKIDTASYLFKVKPFHIIQQVKNIHYVKSKDKNFSLCWYDKKVAIVNQPILDLSILNKYDYIVVGNDAVDLSFISSDSLSTQVWIFDSSNSWTYISKLKKIENLQYHATKTEPAYVLDMNHPQN